MILIDANLPLYAYDAASEQHVVAKRWLEDILSRAEPIRLPWVTVLAFLRISTSPRAFRRPLLIEQALSIVSDWLASTHVSVIDPADRHFEILTALLPASQASSSLVTDGHLAALAIEHGATLYSTDRDFTRFPELRFVNPLEAVKA